MKVETMPEAGTGIRIALLDSGVRVPALRLTPGQCVHGQSFVSGTPSWNDWDGHGTQCASRLIDVQIGLVPGASLTSLRVRRGAFAVLESLTSALRWLLGESPRSHWDLVLFGVGFAARTRDEAPYDELHSLVHELDQRGTLLVAPAGNRNFASSRFIDHPARYADVISIGALLSPDRGSHAWAGTRDLGPRDRSIDFWVQGSEVSTRQLSGALAPAAGTSFAAANGSALLARYLGQRRTRCGHLRQNAAQTIRSELRTTGSLHHIALLQPAIERAISGEELCARSA